jgi:hypothetical protein
MLIDSHNREYRDDDEDQHQGNGKAEHGLFDPPFGAIHTRLLTEDAPQTSPPHLKQEDDYQYNGQYNLGDIEIGLHY